MAERPAPPAQPGQAVPVSALLSQTLVAFTIEADNEAEHRLPHRTTEFGPSDGATAAAPWLTSLLMWANCLRQLPDGGITLTELRRRAGTETNLDGMRRWRYGAAAQQKYQARAARIENAWGTRFGAPRVAALRAALEPLAVPHYPVTLHRGGYPDGS
jgi:hypothetical protein